MKAIFFGRARLLCLIASAVVVSACDPEALVKQKVPEPVRSLLTWTTQAQPQQGPGAPAGIEVTGLEVVSPANEAFFATDQPVPFQMKVDAKSGAVPDKELSWTVTEQTKKQVTNIGRGRSVERKLPTGTYVVEASYQAADGKKLTATAKFRVAPAVQGNVMTKGAGLPDVELVLTDLDGKNVISRVRSNKTGTFFVEIPEKGEFRLAPYRSGFSFSPIFRIVSRDSKPEELAFQAARAQTGGVRFTLTQESDDALWTICPGQTMFVKATVSSEAPLKRLDAHLVTQARGAERVTVPIGSAEFPESPGEPAQPTLRTVKVQLPATWTEAFFGNTYTLVLTAHDVNGATWSSETTHPITADVATCVRHKFAEAVAFQDQGKFEEANDIYDLIADLQRPLGQALGFPDVLEKVLFNRGLINLQWALGAERGSVKWSAFLTRALSDFQEVNKLHSRDAGASFLAGVVNYLTGDRDAAIESFQAAIKGDPKSAEGYEFRARVLVGTGRAGNLSQAVDDFTQALNLKPGAKGLREARKATLALEVATLDQPRNAPVDVSSVPLGPLEKGLDLDKFGRR